jgi:hypothetical protein
MGFSALAAPASHGRQRSTSFHSCFDEAAGIVSAVLMSRREFLSRKLLACVALGALSLGLAATGPAPAEADGAVQHVLLISIDGMHALDFINCANGIAGLNGGKPYCPYLVGLKTTGVDYLDASTSKPSDSFPGLMAIVSGGSPRTVGAFYDSRIRSLTRSPVRHDGKWRRWQPGRVYTGKPDPAPPPSSTKALISTRRSSTAALPASHRGWVISVRYFFSLEHWNIGTLEELWNIGTAFAGRVSSLARRRRL